MKIKIDDNGHLNIERAGKFKKQFCPYGPEGINCGDWCPLFGEPMDELPYFEVSSYCGETMRFTPPMLGLCRVALRGEIIDEREKGGER